MTGPRPGDSQVTTVTDTEPGVIAARLITCRPSRRGAVRIDAPHDLWSLCVVLYEMVAGRLPFEGESSGDVIAAILKSEPVLLAEATRDFPEGLEQIISKGLRKDKEERYRSAEELLADLRNRIRDQESKPHDARAGTPSGNFRGLSDPVSRPTSLFYDFGPFRLDSTERVLAARRPTRPATPKPSRPAGVVERHGHVVGRRN